MSAAATPALREHGLGRVLDDRVARDADGHARRGRRGSRCARAGRRHYAVAAVREARRADVEAALDGEGDREEVGDRAVDGARLEGGVALHGRLEGDEGDRDALGREEPLGLGDQEGQGVRVGEDARP